MDALTNQLSIDEIKSDGICLARVNGQRSLLPFCLDLMNH